MSFEKRINPTKMHHLFLQNNDTFSYTVLHRNIAFYTDDYRKPFIREVFKYFFHNSIKIFY